MKKYSILGLVLLAASAVTAAFIPSDPGDDVATAPGTLQPSTDRFGIADLTCRPGEGNACDYTVTSSPSAPGSSTSINQNGSITFVQGVFTGTGTTIYP